MTRIYYSHPQTLNGVHQFDIECVVDANLSWDGRGDVDPIIEIDGVWFADKDGKFNQRSVDCGAFWKAMGAEIAAAAEKDEHIFEMCRDDGPRWQGLNGNDPEQGWAA